MTSPNATATATLTVPVATVPDSIHAGLRLEWVTAEDPDSGLTATLTSGAGCGSSYMTLAIERPHAPTIYETVDVRDFLPAWIEAALDRASTPADQETTNA